MRSRCVESVTCRRRKSKASGGSHGRPAHLLRRSHGPQPAARGSVDVAAAGFAARSRAARRGAGRTGGVGLRRQGLGPLGRHAARDRVGASGQGALQRLRPCCHLRPERAPPGCPGAASRRHGPRRRRDPGDLRTPFQISTDDPVLRSACYRVYNDWLLDFCKAAPDRLIGLPMLPETPEAAVAELERVIAKGGVRQVNLMIANVNPKLDDPAWEPLWQTLEQSGVILSWHITVFVGKPGDRAVGKAASVFENTKFFLANFLEPFVDLFAWGILERHPTLRMVMAEAGTGWLPWLVQELDYRHWRLWEAKEFWADKGGAALVTKPSDLFKRQIYATFQDDHVAMSLIPFFGDGHLLWASDYPHPDSVWPHSRAAIERQMRHLSPEMRRKLTRDNAAALYGLGGS